MNVTITFEAREETSAGMALSALSLAASVMDGELNMDASERETIIRDLRNLRNKIRAGMDA